MLYTEKEKHEIERVKEVFAEHLRQSPDFELLWSDKVGYVWLTIGVNPVYVDTGIRIESAADLCGKCLDDVATDVLYGVMSNVRFDELELMLMAMFEQPTLKDTIQVLMEVQPLVAEDAEMSALVQQTIPKMQRLTEPQFKGLELEWYKPEEPNKKTGVAEK